MNKQEALTVFPTKSDACLHNRWKYQNPCGFVGKLASAPNLICKTVKGCIDFGIDLGRRSRFAPRGCHKESMYRELSRRNN